MVKKSPNTMSPVNTPPINITVSSFLPHSRGRLPRRNAQSRSVASTFFYAMEAAQVLDNFEYAIEMPN